MPILSPNPGVVDIRESLGSRYGVVEESLGSSRDVDNREWIVDVMIRLNKSGLIYPHMNYLICSCWSCKTLRFQEIGIKHSHWTRLENWI